MYVVVVEGYDFRRRAGYRSLRRLYHRLLRLFHKGLQVFDLVLERFLAGLFKCGRDVVHPLHEGDAQPGHRQLLGAVHGPESVGEVVVLDAAELLYAAVAAVVVGQQQALVGHDLSGAASAELDYRVFERTLVYRIYLFRRQPAAGLLQGLGVHFLDKRQQPHPFVGAYRCRADQKRAQGAKYLLHI